MRQSLRALEIANQMRIEAADYKRECKMGRIDMCDAISNCDLPITLGQLLRSFPRWGEVRAMKACANAGLPTLDISMGSTSSHYRTITPAERRRLLDALDGKRIASTPVRYEVVTDEKEIFGRLCEIGCTTSQIARFFGWPQKRVLDEMWARRVAA